MKDVEVVARLLGRLGRPTTLPSLHEECGVGPTLAAAARALRARGIDARVVRVAPNELQRLRLPTLIELEGGAHAILTEVRGFRATLESGDGRTRVVDARKTDVLTGRVIDRSPQSVGLRLAAHAFDLVRKDPVVRRSLLLVLVFASMVSAVGFGTPIIAATALGEAAPNRARALLSLLSIATVTLAAQRSWLVWFRERGVMFLEARAGTALRRALVDKLMGVSLLEVEALGLGPARQALSAVDRATAISLVLYVATVEGILGLGYLVLVVVALPWAAFVLSLVAAGLVFVCVAFGPRIAARSAMLERASERQRVELVELVTGARTIAIAAARRPLVARWLRAFVDEGALAARHEYTVTKVHTVIDVVEVFTLALLLVWGAAACLDGRIGVGMVLGVVQAAGSFLWAVTRLARAALEVAELSVHVSRADAVLTLRSSPPARPLAAPASGTEPLVVVRDVAFRYREDGPWVIDGVSLEVRAGQHVTLRWPSGRGKTTLLRLIAGLAVPSRGIVKVAGLDARHARGLITYLPQDTYLFAASVLDNLVILSGGASRERIFAAAAATGLQRIVEGWPMRYETLMTSGGTNLSGGERQLVVLTACIASERPLLLLDEAMSHIDRITQASLARRGLLSGRTVVRVVHAEVPLARPSEASSSHADHGEVGATSRAHSWSVEPHDERV